MKTVPVHLGPRSYDILIGPGLLDRAPGIFEQHGIGRRIFLVSNQVVFQLYGLRLLEGLRGRGFQTTEVLISDGEQYKSLETVEGVYSRLIEERVDRGSTLVALGGGVTGDIAGFAAATILRGIPCIQIPTTLLSQVDSSVGGKTGVNHRLGKNMIGVFSQPNLVCIDTDTLSTLPQREFQSGLYEVVKYGLICDRTFFELFDGRLEEIQFKSPEIMSEVIGRCCQIKAGITSNDEKEQDLRRILNFGHTIGHALEAATGYGTLTHGEAIGWGMLAETRLSEMKANLPTPTAERIMDCVSRVGVLPPVTSVPVEKILDAMKLDKKRQGSRMVFVLLQDIGEAVIVDDLDDEEVVRAWEQISRERRP